MTFKDPSTVETVKSVVDSASITVLVGIFLGALPHIAAVLTVVWAIFRLLNEIETYRHRWKKSNG